MGKNLIGAFYQPRAVLADTSLLATLPARELRAGYAEVVKYGLIGNASFFDWLEQHGDQVLALEPDALQHAIHTSCCAKARIVETDEREAGMRPIEPCHTFGHAFETAAKYDGRLLHGEAVAAGLGLAFDLSVALSAPLNAADRIKSHLKVSGLPFGHTSLPAGSAPPDIL